MIEVGRKVSKLIIPICGVTFVFLLFGGALAAMVQEEFFHGDPITLEKISIVIIGFLFLVLPFILMINYFVKKRGIAVTDEMIIIKSLFPQKVSFEDIKKIEIEFWILVLKTSSIKKVNIRNMAIFPIGSRHPYRMNWDHFSQEQFWTIYSAFRTSPILDSVMEERYPGRDMNVSDWSGKARRDYRYEDIKNQINYYRSRFTTPPRSQ